jgi:hypothetical protein
MFALPMFERSMKEKSLEGLVMSSEESSGW